METNIPSEVREAGQKARELTFQAGTAAAAQPSVTDALTKKINEAYSANADIIGNLDEATQGYFNAPSEARVKYQDIFNPFQRENLVNQYQSQTRLPVLSLSNLLGSRLGRIDDLVGAGTRAYEADVNRQLAEAQLAQNLYGDMLNEYQIGESLRQQPRTDIIEAGGRIMLIDTSTGEVIQDLGAAPVSGGGSGTVINFGGIPGLSDLLGGGTPSPSTPTMSEPKPTSNPGNASGVSPGGQWYWDAIGGEWIPII